MCRASSSCAYLTLPTHAYSLFCFAFWVKLFSFHKITNSHTHLLSGCLLIVNQPMSTSPNLLDFSSEANDLSEVDEYLASKIDSFDSFKRGEFKNVSKVFLKTNTPEPANTRSERLFSRGKLMFNTLRTNLSDDNFDKLLLLNCNKDL